MLASKKRSLPAGTLAEGGEDATASIYEKSRSKRIKENMERMKKLGIMNLSLNLKPDFSRFARVKPGRPLKPAKSSSPFSDPLSRRSLTARCPSDAPSARPLRRSSRLQNVAPVSYSECKGDESLSSVDRADWSGGHREEVYAEEHEKLLGSCEMEWTLFVDGYDNSGKRIYDPVKGKTCHQCRQKTLGHHTTCLKCNLVQGQFCGDCLCMRYGENVLEVEKNPSWICPVCRGICNCSLCRVKKGWAPTGTFYKKARSLGYKSVAHYLILTRRGHSTDDKSLEPNSMTDLPSGSSDCETSAMDEEGLEQAANGKSLEKNAL